MLPTTATATASSFWPLIWANKSRRRRRLVAPLGDELRGSDTSSLPVDRIVGTLVSVSARAGLELAEVECKNLIHSRVVLTKGDSNVAPTIASWSPGVRRAVRHLDRRQ